MYKTVVDHGLVIELVLDLAEKGTDTVSLLLLRVGRLCGGR